MHQSTPKMENEPGLQFPETADIETSSDEYASRFAGPIGSWLLSIQEQGTRKMLADIPPGRILDVGGGHAQVTEFLLDLGHHVTVLGSADVCGHRLARFTHTGRCEFNTGNILDMPYPDRSFDVVISYRLLPHVARWREFLRELARVARGAVVLDYPEVKSANILEPLLFKIKKQIEKNTREFRSFRRSEIVDVMALEGFALLDEYKQFFFPMVVHRMMKKPGFSSMLESGARTMGLTGLLGSPVILKLARQTEK